MSQADLLDLVPKLHVCLYRRFATQEPVVRRTVHARQMAHLFHCRFALLLHHCLDLGIDAGSVRASLLRRSSSIRRKAPLKKRFSTVSWPTSFSSSSIREPSFSASSLS